MQKISSIIKPQIRNNSTSVIKETNKLPSLKLSTSENNIKNVNDLFIHKVIVHLLMLLHLFLLLMIDGVNLILLIIQYYHHKVHLLVIR